MPSMKFSRAWLNLHKVFPPQGEWEPPEELARQVVPIFMPLQNIVTTGLYFGVERGSKALSAGNNSQSLAEPSAGRVFVPVALSANNPDGATRRVESFLIASGNASAGATDVWGSWGLHLAFGQSLGNLTDVDVATLRYTPLHAVPHTRGSQMQIQWIGMTGGNNADYAYLYLDLPGEAVNMDMLVPAQIANLKPL